MAKEFDIVEELLGFMLMGTEWVLWLLLFLSVYSVAITMERAWYFWKQRIDFEDFVNISLKIKYFH